MRRLAGPIALATALVASVATTPPPATPATFEGEPVDLGDVSLADGELLVVRGQLVATGEVRVGDGPLARRGAPDRVGVRTDDALRIGEQDGCDVVVNAEDPARFEIDAGEPFTLAVEGPWSGPLALVPWAEVDVGDADAERGTLRLTLVVTGTAVACAAGDSGDTG